MADNLGKPLGQLIGGVGGYFLGQKLKNDTQEQAKEIYDMGINRLKELMTPEPIRNTGITNGQINPPEQIAPDYNKGLQSLYDTQGNLTEYGDIGQNYSKGLQGFFEDAVKLNAPPKKEYREVGGQLLDITDPNNIQVLYGEPKKEKPGKRNVSDYSNMSIDDALKLDPNELENAFDYFNADVQAQLKSKYTQFNEVEKTTRSGYRRTGSRRLGKDKKTDNSLPNDLFNETEQTGEVNTDLWADVRNAENKITEKYNKFNEEQKKGLQGERVRIANELKQFDAEFASGQYTRDEMIDALNEYIAELEKAGVDDDVLDEAFTYIKKRAMELGVAF